MIFFIFMFYLVYCIRLRQSESEPTDMIPVDMRPAVTEPLAITENPFNTEALTENSIVTELNAMGKEDLGLLLEEPIPKASLKGEIQSKILHL